MTNSNSPADQLDQELEAARQLQQVLKQEQALLIAASIDGLGASTEQKALLIARMAELANTRLNALARAGLAPEESSMQQWLDRLPAGSNARAAAQARWDELLQLMQVAKETNRTNGLLIGTHMSRNQSALQVLQGNQGAEIYGRDGQTSVQSSRRSLVVG